MLADPWWIHCVATDVRSGGMSRERTQAVSPVWVTSCCAGPPAAWQVNLNKRTPNSSALTWRYVTRLPADNVLDPLSWRFQTRCAAKPPTAEGAVSAE